MKFVKAKLKANYEAIEGNILCGNPLPGFADRIPDFSVVLQDSAIHYRLPACGDYGGAGEKKKFFCVLVENLFTNRKKCDTILADRLLGTLFLRQKLIEGEVKP